MAVCQTPTVQLLWLNQTVVPVSTGRVCSKMVSPAAFSLMKMVIPLVSATGGLVWQWVVSFQAVHQVFVCLRTFCGMNPVVALSWSMEVAVCQTPTVQLLWLNQTVVPVSTGRVCSKMVSSASLSLMKMVIPLVSATGGLVCQWVVSFQAVHQVFVCLRAF